MPEANLSVYIAPEAKVPFVGTIVIVPPVTVMVIAMFTVS
jgi:hypothetical protein